MAFGTFSSPLFHFSLHREPRRNTHTKPAAQEPTAQFLRLLTLRWIPHTTFFTLEEKFSFTRPRTEHWLFFFTVGCQSPGWLAGRKCTFSRTPKRPTLSNPPETEPPELAKFSGTALAGDFACQIALNPHTIASSKLNHSRSSLSSEKLVTLHFSLTAVVVVVVRSFPSFRGDDAK